MAKLIMLVGLPGSGKSTYGKKLCASERELLLISLLTKSEKNFTEMSLFRVTLVRCLGLCIID